MYKKTAFFGMKIAILGAYILPVKNRVACPIQSRGLLGINNNPEYYSKSRLWLIMKSSGI